MARIAINYGTTAGDGTGDIIFTSFQKINNNFIDLYNFNYSGTASFNLLESTLVISDSNIQEGQRYAVVSNGAVLNEVLGVVSVAAGVLTITRTAIDTVIGLTSNLPITFFRV